MRLLCRPLAVLIVLLLNLIAGAGCHGDTRSEQEKKAWANLEEVHDVVIGQGGGRPLHVEIAYSKLPFPSPRPAVIWVHGGGWSGGSHKPNAANYLALFGYFTASVEYRLSGEAKWPAQIEDCKLAVRWLRANAAQYHVDPDRIGVMGASAGGHLAAMLGVTPQHPEFEGHGGYEGVSSAVQAVADLSGPTDLSHGNAGLMGASEAEDIPMLVQLFGGPFRNMKDTWTKASPLEYVTKAAPPCLVIHGDRDPIVPIAHSEKWVEALEKAGVPVKFIRVKGGDHGYTAAKGSPPAEPDVKSLFLSVKDFFDKELAPKKPKPE